MSVKQVTLLFALLLCSCGKEERQNVPENSSIVGDPIVGEPIQSVEIDTNESQFGLIPKIDKNQMPSISDNENEQGIIIEEGIVVDGVPRPNDSNESEVTIENHLPPMDENSKFERIAFRDLSNFTYDVSWERDGKDFDFASYSKRVPKRLREKTGANVAVEGFMLPTVVDENNKVKEFLLLPDQMSCCFGQTPEANGWVVVSAQDGVEVLMDQIIRATGTLTVEERWDEEFFVGLFHLDCEEITGPSL